MELKLWPFKDALFYWCKLYRVGGVCTWIACEGVVVVQRTLAYLEEGSGYQ